MKLKPVYFIPVIAWFIIANILLLMPGKDIPEITFLNQIYFDKWVHIGLFAGLTFLTAFPFIKSGRCSKGLLLKTGILFILYGILIEYLQKYYASDRTFDITDMVADTVGCIVGCVSANWLFTRKLAKNKPL